jgi:hypothetical protein
MKTSTKTPSRFRCVITLLAMSFVANGFGQDTIIIRNGPSIIGHVIEISATEVKYKKMGITDGPLYIEDKSGIESIHYKNGFRDVFPEIKPWQLPVAKVEKKEEITVFKPKPVLVKAGGAYLYNGERLKEAQLHQLLLAVNDPDVNYRVRMAKRARGLQYIGFAAVPFAVLSLFSYMTTNDIPDRKDASAENTSKLLLGCAVISFGSSYYFKANRKHHNAEALRLYKQKFD